VSKQHGVPLNLVLQSTKATRARGHGDPFSEAADPKGLLRFVRKGLEGRGAVAPKSKKPYTVFLILT
jgi:hypothetical protein